MAEHPAQSLDDVERLYEESLRELARRVRDADSSLREASQRLPDSRESWGRLREMQRTFEELEETLRGAGAETGRVEPGAKVTDVLQTGGGLLGETTDEAGRLVQRTIDGTGDIIESTLDESGSVVSEELVARLRDMTPSTTYTTENGYTVNEYTEDVGIAIRHTLDEAGDLRGLQVVKEDTVQ